jgi:hypothetical protein
MVTNCGGLMFIQRVYTWRIVVLFLGLFFVGGIKKGALRNGCDSEMLVEDGDEKVFAGRLF